MAKITDFEPMTIQQELHEWRQISADLAKIIVKMEDDVSFARYILRELSNDDSMQIRPIDYK